MLISQRKKLYAAAGPLPLHWADCHLPHTDYPIPGARTPAERHAAASSSASPSNSASPSDSAASANSASPALPQRTDSEHNLCRNATHLSDSTAHPRFLFRSQPPVKQRAGGRVNQPACESPMARFSAIWAAWRIGWSAIRSSIS